MAMSLASAVDAGAARPSRAAPSLRVTGGDVLQLESSWPGGGEPGDAELRATLTGLQLASDDGAWRLDGLDATLVAAGARLQIALAGRDLPLRAPWFAAPAAPVRVALAGDLDVASAPGGWSVAVPRLAPRVRARPGAARRGLGRRGRIGRRHRRLAGGARGAAGARRHGAARSRRWRAGRRTRSGRRSPTGRVEAASAELGGDTLRRVELQLRGASFAAAPDRPETTALDLDLAWDGQRLDGRVLAGRVGAAGAARRPHRDLAAAARRNRGRARHRGAAGRHARGCAAARWYRRASRRRGRLRPWWRRGWAARALPGTLATGLAGRARIDARLRIPATDGAPGADLELAIDVDDARWQPVAAAAPLSGLRGRLRADGRGLRDGRLEGRWLGGPVQLRLEADAPAELQADGQRPAAGRRRSNASGPGSTWSIARAHGELDWNAELRRDRDDDDTGDARARRPGAAAATARRHASPRADGRAAVLASPRRTAGQCARRPALDARCTAAAAPWRIDRGTVTLGDGTGRRRHPGRAGGRRPTRAARDRPGSPARSRASTRAAAGSARWWARWQSATCGSATPRSAVRDCGSPARARARPWTCLASRSPANCARCTTNPGACRRVSRDCGCPTAAGGGALADVTAAAAHRPAAAGRRPAARRSLARRARRPAGIGWRDARDPRHDAASRRATHARQRALRARVAPPAAPSCRSPTRTSARCCRTSARRRRCAAATPCSPASSAGRCSLAPASRRACRERCS